MAIGLLATACASSSSRRPAVPQAKPAQEEQQARAGALAFAVAEGDAIDWLAAADPRLAVRAATSAPEALLQQIGTDAVLAEDTTAQIRGRSLDLFAFRARTRALNHAAERVAAFREPLSDTGPPEGAIARPKLERELLERLIREELARAEDEAQLGESSGDLVRGMLSTWTPPTAPQEWPDRDAWANKHLLEIRESLRERRPRTGPPDIDVALYPLERLLAPLQFPRASAAIAQLRVALDADERAIPPIMTPEVVARSARIHLGVALDPTKLQPRLERITTRLRELATRALDAAGDARPSIEARARELLFVERPCPAVPGTRVRTMGPPPERAALCGALRALTEEAAPAAALVALHDDVLLAFAAVTTAPPPRTGLLSHPEDDVVESIKRTARERPVVALGVALAADLIYGKDAADNRLRRWRALGEAPLDIVEREIQGVDDGR